MSRIEGRVPGGVTNAGGGPEAVRLEDPRHLGNRQPFGKCHVDDVHVAAGNLVDDFERRHRAVETVLACLQTPAFAAHPERDAKRRDIANDAGGHQSIADRAAARALRNVDELFGRFVASIRLIDAARTCTRPRAPAASNNTIDDCE